MNRPCECVRTRVNLLFTLIARCFCLFADFHFIFHNPIGRLQFNSVVRFYEQQFMILFPSSFTLAMFIYAFMRFI